MLTVRLRREASRRDSANGRDNVNVHDCDFGAPQHSCIQVALSYALLPLLRECLWTRFSHNSTYFIQQCRPMGDQRCVSLDLHPAVHGSPGTNNLHERDLVHSQIHGHVLYLSSFADG